MKCITITEMYASLNNLLAWYTTPSDMLVANSQECFCLTDHKPHEGGPIQVQLAATSQAVAEWIPPHFAPGSFPSVSTIMWLNKQ